MLSTPNTTRRFRKKNQQQDWTPKQKLVCFTSGVYQFAIAIEQVQYILKDFVSCGCLENGLSLVRANNEVITLIDLSKIFLDISSNFTFTYLIVCTIKCQKLAISVTELPSIVEVSEEQLSEVPSLYQKSIASRAVQGVINISDRPPIFFLNLENF